ncbi:MAG: hypothetical protein RCG16_02740 [Rickettsia hoogstraalii]
MEKSKESIRRGAERILINT